MKRIQAATAVLLGSVALVAGCASTPPAPTADMTRAKAAIEQAERAGAAEFANEELSASHRKMELAQAAVVKNHTADAARLVDESYADAHLAQLTAQSAKSAKASADVDRSIDVLQREANRPATP